jgi:hypothetical protein
MTMVGGFDVHRKQITFDYVDTDTGLVRCGEIRPATRKTLRAWIARAVRTVSVATIAACAETMCGSLSGRMWCRVKLAR